MQIMEEDWKVGDIAICVNAGQINPNGTGTLPPLRAGCEYRVQAVRKCDCGSVSLDVGIASKGGIICECGGVSSPKLLIWWCNQKRFVKKKIEHKEDALIERVLQENQ